MTKKILRYAGAVTGIVVATLPVLVGCSTATSSDASATPASTFPSPPAISTPLASPSTSSGLPQAVAPNAGLAAIEGACEPLTSQQASLISHGFGTLQTVNEEAIARADSQLVEQNITIFVDHVENICGQEFTTGQRHQIVVAIVQSPTGS